MTTALWVVMAVLFAAFIVWRLRRANHVLSAILREKPEVESSDETTDHGSTRRRKS